jgi:hypothetical protein
MINRLKRVMRRLGYAWKSKTCPDDRLILQASLVMVGVVVNVFLILTVLLSLSQTLRSQLPESYFTGGIKTLTTSLIAFTGSLGSSMLSLFQANEDLRGFWTLVAFLLFLFGLIFFLLFAFSVFRFS